MKNGQTLTSEKKKREIVHVYVLLFAMCIVVALLTYVIPAGSYERETVDGQTIVVAGSYQLEERDPIGIFDLFNSVAKGWSQSASIIFLVFMVGGAIKVIEDTGVIDKVLTNSMGKLRGKEEGIVILVSLILSIMGCTGTFSTANIAIVPIALAFSRKLGYDRFLAFALSYLAVNAGFFRRRSQHFHHQYCTGNCRSGPVLRNGASSCRTRDFLCYILCIHRAVYACDSEGPLPLYRTL